MVKKAEAIFGLSGSWVKNSKIFGRVLFIQNDINSSVKVKVEIVGLPNGEHGFHVHEKKLTPKLLKYSDCCNKLGGHFNGSKSIWKPDNLDGTKHGKHVGDLCFNLNSKNSKVIKNFVDNKISLYKSSPNCIIERSLIIHEKKDDKGLGKNNESLITGNAGKRIACTNINLI